MRSGSNQFRNRMGQRRIRVDVENGERVSALLDTPFAEDDGDEVHTRRLEEGSAGSVGEEPDVNRRYVSDDVRAIVHDSDAGETLVVHEGQCLC